MKLLNCAIAILLSSAVFASASAESKSMPEGYMDPRDTVLMGPPEDVAAVIEAHEAMTVEFNSRDLDGMSALHHEGIALRPPTHIEIVEGKPAVRKYFAQGFEDGGEAAIEATRDEIFVGGDFGIVFGRWRTLSDEAPVFGRYLTVMRRDESSEHGWTWFREMGQIF